MFQGVFRKRGRPPEQLLTGGYDNQPENETGQIPVHQSLIPLEKPRQLPLAPVRELEHDVVMQQENDAGKDSSVQPMLPQQSANIPKLQDRRLACDPYTPATLE